jgi:hypothetical protein
MVKGVDKFRECFKDYSDQFILIGGTACDFLMREAGLEFRRTKDIDIVLIIEVLNEAFCYAFLDFISAGKYKNQERSGGEKQFYRFSDPKDESYPKQIELLSKKAKDLKLLNDRRYTPISVQDETTTLSALILDEDYYQYIKSHRVMLSDLPFIDVECIIVLKAKAWLNNTERRAKGEAVNSIDITKHKNDIVRLSQLLTPDKHLPLPPSIKEDMIEFIKSYEKSGIDPKSLKVNSKPEEVFARLKSYYLLDEKES